jgi:hypothetical protein
MRGENPTSCGPSTGAALARQTDIDSFKRVIKHRGVHLACVLRVYEDKISTVNTGKSPMIACPVSPTPEWLREDRSSAGKSRS